MSILPHAALRRLNNQVAALGLELRIEQDRWQVHEGHRLLADFADAEAVRLFLLQYGAVVNFCKPFAITDAQPAEETRPSRKMRRRK